MAKVKIEKDVYVRDEFGVRIREFVAGQEIEEHKYNEIFRRNVPVEPEALPQEPVFIGTEELNGSILPETKELFVEEEAIDAPVKDEKVAKTAKVETTEEVAEEAPKSKKKGSK